MHIKYADLPGARDDELLVRIVKPGKRAGRPGMLPEVEAYVDTLKPDDRYTYALDNAMGYSEYFGANSNTDWYGHNPHLDFNGLLHAPPKFSYGAAVQDAALAAQYQYGYGTFLNATVYAHHKNQDRGTLGFGDVLFAFPNHRMKRIELVKRVDNALITERGYSSILDRLNAGERVDVSMGTKIPFDLCSICTDWDAVREARATFDPKTHANNVGVAILAYHRMVAPIRGLAVTRDEYCPCMRNQRGAILPDGRKVFVYNDFVRFFDISFVWVGADRTARVMWFLAQSKNAPEVLRADPLRQLAAIASQILQMKTSSVKTSEMEKQIRGGFSSAVISRADREPSLALKGLEGMSSKLGPQAVLSSLGALGIVAKPEEFTAIVRPHVAGLSKIAELHFPTTVTAVDDTCAVDPTQCQLGMMKAASPIMPARSSYAPYLKPRMVPLDETTQKKVDFIADPIWEKVAAMYNGYRLSLLEKSAGLAERGLPLLDTLPGFAEKRASAELALLLLGLGPVVHLVASHLEKDRGAGRELGAMESFVADNPTFTSVATIGAGLRAAMGVQQAGGILPAASALFRAASTML